MCIDLLPVDASFVEKQMKCVTGDTMEIHALKTGMLFDRDMVYARHFRRPLSNGRMDLLRNECDHSNGRAERAGYAGQVQHVHALPSNFVEKERRCVADDMEIHAPKTGMLFDRDKTSSFGRGLRLCLDIRPHLACSGGLDGLADSLFPLATIVTQIKMKWSSFST